MCQAKNRSRFYLCFPKSQIILKRLYNLLWTTHTLSYAVKSEKGKIRKKESHDSSVIYFMTAGKKLMCTVSTCVIHLICLLSSTHVSPGAVCGVKPDITFSLFPASGSLSREAADSTFSVKPRKRCRGFPSCLLRWSAPSRAVRLGEGFAFEEWAVSAPLPRSNCGGIIT